MTYFILIISLYFVYSSASVLPLTLSEAAQATTLTMQSGNSVVVLLSGDTIAFKDPGVNQQITITMTYNWDSFGVSSCQSCMRQLLFSVDGVQHDCHSFYPNRVTSSELSVTYTSDGSFRNILTRETLHYTCDDVASVTPNNIIGYIYLPTPAPTQDPSKNPSAFPTNHPTNEPTTAPSNNPTNNPTNDPTNDPTHYPTKYPTKNPTLDPTHRPTTEPTTDPTQVPSLSPSLYPTVSPTSSPSVSPSSKPTVSPTTPSPTLPGRLSCGDAATGDYNDIALPFTVRMPFTGHVTLDASASDFVVTLISSDGISSGNGTLNLHLVAGDHIFTMSASARVKGTFHVRIVCTSDNPTFAPSNNPTPTPTISPTKTPTTVPTISTISPTYNPTMKPTFCYEGKYQRIMKNGDGLWENELFVSSNCLCQLTVQNNGHLELLGKASRLSNEFNVGWKHITNLSDISGADVAKLEITTKGLILNQYPYKNVPSFTPRELWSVKWDSQNLTLYISDDCCLKLTEAQREGEIVESIIWSVCAEGIFMTMSPKNTLLESTNHTQTLTEEDQNNAIQEKKENISFVVVCVVIAILVAIITAVVYRKVHQFNKETWAAPPKKKSRYMSKDMIEMETRTTRQITEWMEKPNAVKHDDSSSEDLGLDVLSVDYGTATITNATPQEPEDHDDRCESGDDAAEESNLLEGELNEGNDTKISYYKRHDHLL